MTWGYCIICYVSVTSFCQYQHILLDDRGNACEQLAKSCYIKWSSWELNLSFLNYYAITTTLHAILYKNGIPVLKHLNGMVAWPRKFGSPNTSSSWTTKRIKATSGLSTSNSHHSFQAGLNPLSAVHHIISLHYILKSSTT